MSAENNYFKLRSVNLWISDMKATFFVAIETVFPRQNDRLKDWELVRQIICVQKQRRNRKWNKNTFRIRLGNDCNLPQKIRESIKTMFTGV